MPDKERKVYEDEEIKALSTIARVLGKLSPDARTRVLNYVSERMTGQKAETEMLPGVSKPKL